MKIARQIETVIVGEGEPGYISTTRNRQVLTYQRTLSRVGNEKQKLLFAWKCYYLVYLLIKERRVLDWSTRAELILHVPYIKNVASRNDYIEWTSARVNLKLRKVETADMEKMRERYVTCFLYAGFEYIPDETGGMTWIMKRAPLRTVWEFCWWAPFLSMCEQWREGRWKENEKQALPRKMEQKDFEITEELIECCYGLSF
jgi:hypothetical protein